MTKLAVVGVATKEATPELEMIFNKYYPTRNTIFLTNAEFGDGGIAAKYNKVIEDAISNKALTDDQWIVFQHDDARPITFVDHIEDYLGSTKADIVGVAGRRDVPPLSPGFWWHGLGQPNFAGCGAVEHIHPETKEKFVSVYGPYPHKVAAADGVWMAIRIGSLRENPELRYDEKIFNGYHFYDADFCATARKLGMYIEVSGIMISHDSGGESAHQQSFQLAQHKFVKKWFRHQKEFNRYSPEEPKKEGK